MQTVATELKRRLDYLKETEETKKRFEKEQMLKFISEGVRYFVPFLLLLMPERLISIILSFSGQFTCAN